MNESIHQRVARSVRVGYLFAKRDLKSEFRSGYLGVSWLFITPVLWTLAFVAVRAALEARGIKLPSDNLPGPVFALIGVLVFQSWFEPFRTVLSSFSRNRSFIKFIGVHPEVFLYAEIIKSCALIVPRIMIAAAALIFFGADGVTPVGIGLAILIFLASVLNGCVIGFLLAPFASLGSDIKNLTQSLSLGFLAGSGAFISIDAIAPGIGGHLFSFYPAAVWVDTARNVLTGQDLFFPFGVAVWCVATLVLWPAAIAFSSVTRPILAEKIT